MINAYVITTSIIKQIEFAIKVAFESSENIVVFSSIGEWSK